MSGKPPSPFGRQQALPMTEAPHLNPKTILAAFDPGEATGVVIVEKGQLTHIATLTFEKVLHLATDEEALFCDFGRVQHFVCERWGLYEHQAESLTHSEMLPVQVIGMLRVMAHLLGVPITFQPASMAKEFVPDSRLRLFPWRLRSDHEKDAARHAITYLSYH